MKYLDLTNSEKQRIDRGYQSLKGGKNRVLLFNGYGVSMIIKSQKWIVEMASYHYKCT